MIFTEHKDSLIKILITSHYTPLEVSSVVIHTDSYDTPHALQTLKVLIDSLLC
jgi:hypothetical protein